MRFTVGQDPETDEYLVGDTRTMHIILRGRRVSGIQLENLLMRRTIRFCVRSRMAETKAV